MDFTRTLALFFARLIMLYSYVIWIRIFLTWISPYPRVGSFTYYMAKIVDPFLGLFRSSKMRMGMMDFSPVIAVGVLSVLQSLLNVYSLYGYLTFGFILSQIIIALWSYGISVYLWITIITLILKIIASFSSNPAFYAMIRAMGDDPISIMVRKCYGARIPRDRTVAIISLIITIMMNFVGQRLFAIIASLAVRIPF